MYAIARPPPLAVPVLPAKVQSSTAAITVAQQRLITSINARTPAIFLARPSYTYLINKRIHGVTDMQIARPSDRLLRASEWYIDSNWIWN